MNQRRHLPEDGVHYPLPRPPVPGFSPGAFVMICPAACFPGVTVEHAAVQRWVYQCALEQAQAVARPSLPERDLLAVWN